MTTAQQTTIARLQDQWGETFTVENTIGETIIVRRASDHEYYEPSPVRYKIDRSGDERQIDSDGFEIEEDEDY